MDSSKKTLRWIVKYTAVVVLAALCTPCAAEQVSLGFMVAGVGDVDLPADLPKVKRGAVVIATFAGGPAFEQLKIGDVITTVAGKAINDSDDLDGVIAEATTAKLVKIAYRRASEEKEWKNGVISIKPVPLASVLATAMESNTNSETKVTFYDYRRPISEYTGKVPMGIYIRTKSNVGLRVMEGDGKFRLALSFCYSAENWLRVEGLNISDDKAPFEIKFPHDLVKHDNNLGTVWEFATIPLTDEQVAQLRKSLKPFGTVQMIGGKEKFDYKLSGADWAAIQTAFALYDLKTAK